MSVINFRLSGISLRFVLELITYRMQWASSAGVCFSCCLSYTKSVFFRSYLQKKKIFLRGSKRVFNYRLIHCYLNNLTITFFKTIHCSCKFPPPPQKKIHKILIKLLRQYIAIIILKNVFEYVYWENKVNLWFIKTVFFAKFKHLKNW